MKWLELKLDTSPAGLDPVSQLLEEQGITGLVIDDEGDFRDFLEHNHQYWDYVDEELMQEKQGLCRITFYLSDDPEGYHRLAQVRMALSQLKAAHPEYAPLLLTMNNLEDADWENNWKQFYKPMEIGERLIVVPEWEQANTQGRIPLILNPGLTFGTGSHATPACLTRWRKPSTAVSGTGSGLRQRHPLHRPPCGWGRSTPSPATSTRSAWRWPMKTPPSTASTAPDTPSGGAMCCRISS